MRIVFVCHPTGGGPWSPQSCDEGIGGSEEAAIHMAAVLARRGHAVDMRRGVNRWFGPVFYGDFDNLPGEPLDVAVVWRRPGLIGQLDERRITPGRTYLWLHDNISPESLESHQHRYRRVMVLSHFHRSRFPGLPDERFFLTSNGIDPAQFDPPNPLRDPFQLVYGSDYVQGLRELLTSWPAIKQAVPSAHLNVFYGWQGIERHNPERAKRLRREFEPLMRSPGITHLGRIGHLAVADQYRRAGVWSYPCSMRETSCISAMKAQAGGAVPAVIPNGALRETVRFGFRTARNYDDLGKERGDALVAEWVEGLIELLRSPERQLSIRRDMVPASKAALIWSRVADSWENEFCSR